MSVSFDAVGPGSAAKISATSPVTWSHTASAGAAVLVLVGMDGTGSISAATYGGNAMTQLVSINLSGLGDGSGSLFVYGIANVGSGASTVSISFGGDQAYCASMSFNGAAATVGAAFGTPATTSGTSGNPHTIAVPGTTASSMIAGFVTDFNGTGYTFSSSNGTLASSGIQSSTNAVGGAACSYQSAGSSTTVGFSGSNTFAWGLAGIEVLAPAGGAAPASQVRPGLSRIRHHQGIYRQQLQPVFPFGPSFAAATLAGAGSAAETAGVTISVAATLAGSGAVSATGLSVVQVTAALAGSGAAVSGVAIGVSDTAGGSGGASSGSGLGVASGLQGLGSASPVPAIGVTDALGGSGGASSGSGLAAASGLAGSGYAVPVPELVVAGSLAGAGSASTPNPNIIFVTAGLAGSASVAVSAPSALAGALAGAGSVSAAATVSVTAVLAGAGSAASFAPSQLAAVAAASGTAGSAPGKVIIKVTAVLAGSGYAVPAPERTFSVTAALAGAAGVAVVPEVFTPVYVDISVYVGASVAVLTAGASAGLGRAVSATRNDGWAARASAGDGKSAAASEIARGATSASKNDGLAASATESVLTAGASIAQRGR